MNSSGRTSARRASPRTRAAAASAAVCSTRRQRAHAGLSSSDSFLKVSAVAVPSVSGRASMQRGAASSSRLAARAPPPLRPFSAGHVAARIAAANTAWRVPALTSTSSSSASISSCCASDVTESTGSSGGGGGVGGGGGGVGGGGGNVGGGGGNVLFGANAEFPGTLLVYRQQAHRDANPERLNLDKRHLTACPSVKGESQLKLLSYQSNNISVISNLGDLPNLVFLDLYDNKIRRISGLEDVPTLRVLMLGKNFIRTMENLENVPKLDVLDLHSNRITHIQNLETLTQLRVLNLAGNEIEKVSGLESLASLAELNLRRNRVNMVETLRANVALDRLFLSQNNLKALSSLDSIVGLNLSEISLDGNPLVANTFYRQHMLDSFNKLQILDGKRITSEERRMFIAIKQLREEQIAIASSEDANGDLTKNGRDGERSESGGTRASLPNTLERSHCMRMARDLWFQHRGLKNFNAAHGYGAFHELAVKKSCLSIYGQCLEVLTSEKISGVRTICFRYVNFNQISPFFQILRELKSLSCLRFSDNDFHCFYQIDTLSIFASIVDVSIQSNPILELPHFRDYLIFRVPSLNIVNGEHVSADGRKQANNLFGPLKVMWRAPTIRRIQGFCSPVLDYVDPNSDEQHALHRRNLVDIAGLACFLPKNVPSEHYFWNSCSNFVESDQMNQMWSALLDELIDNMDRND